MTTIATKKLDWNETEFTKSKKEKVLDIRASKNPIPFLPTRNLIKNINTAYSVLTTKKDFTDPKYIESFCSKHYELLFEPFFIDSEAIFEIRSYLKLSQKEFGENLKVSQRRICNFERNQSALEKDYVLIKERLISFLDTLPSKSSVKLCDRLFDLLDKKYDTSNFEKNKNCFLTENGGPLSRDETSQESAESKVAEEILTKHGIWVTSNTNTSVYENIEKVMPVEEDKYLCNRLIELHTIPIDLRCGTTDQVVKSIKAILMLSDREFDTITRDLANEFRSSRLIHRLAEAINDKDELTKIRQFLLKEGDKGLLSVKSNLIRNFGHDDLLS